MLAWVAGKLESPTLTVKMYAPAAVGVPETNPVSDNKLKPGGREDPDDAVQLHAYGGVPPLAAKENPCVPA